MAERLRVTVYDGKYTVIVDADGDMRALRYGHPWRDLTGDGLVLALALEVDDLRNQLKAAGGSVEQQTERMRP